MIAPLRPRAAFQRACRVITLVLRRVRLHWHVPPVGVNNGTGYNVLTAWARVRPDSRTVNTIAHTTYVIVAVTSGEGSEPMTHGDVPAAARRPAPVAGWGGVFYHKWRGFLSERILSVS